MRRIKTYLLVLFVSVTFVSKAQFTPGNIVVCRIGEGLSTSPSITNSNAFPVFLDEYTPLGVLIQTIALPIADNGQHKKLTLLTPSGFATGGGMLTLSADGQFLVLAGFNASVGTTDLYSTRSDISERVIGVVDYNGIINTTTALTDYGDRATPIAAVSTNGVDIWCSSTGGGFNLAGVDTKGVRYTTTGATTSIQLNTTPRFLATLNITNGQLYVSDGSKIHTVGTSLPQSPGQVVTSLPGLDFGLRMQFVFADLNPNIPGPDVLYVCDEYYGLEKHSLVNGSWVVNGSIGTVGINEDLYRGLAAIVSGTTVTLFATRKGGNSNSVGGGELVTVTDATGYNGAFSGIPTVIATTLIDQASFRGVALVPQQAPLCPAPSSLFAYNITPNTATISWNVVNGMAGYEFALNGNATPPLSGTAIASNSYNATGLVQGQTYYFHVRTDCGNFNTSSWTTVSFVPNCIAPPFPTVSNVGHIAEVRWNSVFGASGYEYAVTTNATAPVSGAATTDTGFVANNLSSVTQYYVHVRSNCGTGGYSVWSTKPFNTPCLNPIVTTSSNGDVKQFKWNKVNGAVNYEYALTTYRTPPLGGTNISDTAIEFSKLNPGTSYYFHVRTKCAEHGGQSIWTTTPFQTTGLDAYPNPVRNTLTIKLYGMSTSNGVVLFSDALGRIVKRISMTTNSIDVNVEDLAAGVYLVRYNDGTNKYMVKVLKQ